jgi:hypothetical protein
MGDEQAIAYLQAYAVLCYLVQRFGKQEPIRVLINMAKSSIDFQASLGATLGMLIEDLDTQWWSILPNER